jgi:hypothetical protein
MQQDRLAGRCKRGGRAAATGVRPSNASCGAGGKPARLRWVRQTTQQMGGGGRVRQTTQQMGEVGAGCFRQPNRSGRWGLCAATGRRQGWRGGAQFNWGSQSCMPWVKGPPLVASASPQRAGPQVGPQRAWAVVLLLVVLRVVQENNVAGHQCAGTSVPGLSQAAAPLLRPAVSSAAPGLQLRRLARGQTKAPASESTTHAACRVSESPALAERFSNAH